MIPCSRYTGGELWVQSADGDVRLEVDGAVGLMMNTSTPVAFYPMQVHATCPWQGDRIVLIAYHVRNLSRWSVEDLSELHGAGFAANTLPD